MKLSQLQTPKQRFAIAACDQRASLAKLLGVDAETEDGRNQLIQVKRLFMETFSPISSAVLTDPEFGLQSLDAKAPNAGLLLSLERSPYDGEEKEDLPPMYEHWGVEDIAANNAAVKLLLYYHPLSYTAEQKRLFVGRVYAQCQARNIPFILEPIVYLPEALSVIETHLLYEMQIQTVKDFTHQCDVLKLEFPVGGEDEFDQKLAAQRCKEISQHARVPWIVLSRGMGFERFILALDIAMKNGASGFAVGRAVWKEIGEFGTWDEKVEFIKTVAKERMQQLIQIVDR